MKHTEGYVSFRGLKTWYRVVGEDEEEGKQPVLALHGGPGATHDYIEPLEGLAETGRRVVFYHRHVCRLPEYPDYVLRSFQFIAEHGEVYKYMNGPSEFHVVGTLLDWDVTSRLGEISVRTLVVTGEHDEATPSINRTVSEAI